MSYTNPHHRGKQHQAENDETKNACKEASCKYLRNPLLRTHRSEITALMHPTTATCADYVNAPPALTTVTHLLHHVRHTTARFAWRLVDAVVSTEETSSRRRFPQRARSTEEIPSFSSFFKNFKHWHVDKATPPGSALPIAKFLHHMSSTKIPKKASRF